MTDDLARLMALHMSDEQQRMLAAMSPDARGLFLERLRDRFFGGRATVSLRDGTIGFFPHGLRADQCWASCVATCLQVPLDLVPDPRIDERLHAGQRPEEINRSAWQDFVEWARLRGLSIVYWPEPPVRAARWIGQVRFDGYFNDHCLVMAGDQVLFDPVDETAETRPVRRYTLSDVAHGFTFEPINEP